MAFRNKEDIEQDCWHLFPWEQIGHIRGLEVIIAARSTLDCVVYFDPNRRDTLPFRGIKREVEAELAPRYRRIRFVPLSHDDVVVCSPFLTSKDEKIFLDKGYKRAPEKLPNGIMQYKLRQGRPDRTLALKRNFDAFYSLAVKTEALLPAIRRLIPTEALPSWLRETTENILYPVCGSTEKWKRRDDNVIRLTREGDLWLGCDDFSVSRTIYPSVVTIPGSAHTQGSHANIRWYRLTPEELQAQFKKEITDCLLTRRNDFDAAALALFMCQNIMKLRLSAEATRRKLLAYRSRRPAEFSAYSNEDKKLRKEILDRHDIDLEENDLRIESWKPSPVDRVLVAFYGGTCPIPYHVPGSAWLRIERLARWAGGLRRDSIADLDPMIADDILDVFHRQPSAFRVLLESQDTCSALVVLDSFLGKTVWEVVQEAAAYVAERSEKFSISYALNDQGHRGAGAHADFPRRHVTVHGPALLLPVDDIDGLWASARSISARGLYAVRSA